MTMTVTPTATPMMAPMAVFDRPPPAPPPSSANMDPLPDGAEEANGVEAVVMFPAEVTVAACRSCRRRCRRRRRRCRCRRSAALHTTCR